MDYIILDLGFDINILTRNTWENMNKLWLDWYPIQLRLANQSKVLLIGLLTQILIEVEGMRTYAYFEVIDIFDYTNPYPTLLGIYWEIDNQSIINFKRRIFHLKTQR